MAMLFHENYSLSSSRRSSAVSNSSSTSPSSSWATCAPTHQRVRSVSPCSFDISRHPSGYSVTDLAACFATSRLRPEAQICYDSCASYANPDEDAGWQLDDDDDSSPRSSRSHARLPPPSRRAQRQLQARLLCSTTHHRDIAALVEQMVEQGEQCTVACAPRLAIVADVVPSIEACSRAAATDDDEGYDSSELSSLSASSSSTSLAASCRAADSLRHRPRLEYRRSTDLAVSGACVSKSARMRKGRKETPRRVRS